MSPSPLPSCSGFLSGVLKWAALSLSQGPAHPAVSGRLSSRAPRPGAEQGRNQPHAPARLLRRLCCGVHSAGLTRSRLGGHEGGCHAAASGSPEGHKLELSLSNLAIWALTQNKNREGQGCSSAWRPWVRPPAVETNLGINLDVRGKPCPQRHRAARGSRRAAASSRAEPCKHLEGASARRSPGPQGPGLVLTLSRSPHGPLVCDSLWWS